MFQSRPARKHEDNDGARKILAEDRGNDDRQSREKIGPEITGEDLARKVPEQRKPADNENCDQYEIGRVMKDKAKNKVDKNAGESESRDTRLP